MDYPLPSGDAYRQDSNLSAWGWNDAPLPRPPVLENYSYYNLEHAPQTYHDAHYQSSGVYHEQRDTAYTNNNHGKKRKTPTKTNTKRCKYFNSVKGCGKGEACSFLHERKPSQQQARKKTRTDQKEDDKRVAPSPDSQGLKGSPRNQNDSRGHSRDGGHYPQAERRAEKRSGWDRRDSPVAPKPRASSPQQEGAAGFLSSLLPALPHDNANPFLQILEQNPYPPLLDPCDNPNPTATTNDASLKKIKEEPSYGETFPGERVLPLAKRVEALINQLAQQREETENYRKKNEELEKRNAALVAEKKRIAEEQAALQQRHEENKRDMEQRLKEMEDAEHQLVERAKRDNALTVMNRQLQEKLKEANEKLETVTKEKADLMDKCAKLVRLIKSLRVEKAQLEKERQDNHVDDNNNHQVQQTTMALKKEPMETSSSAAEVKVLKERLETLEERVKALERGRTTQPQQQEDGKSIFQNEVQEIQTVVSRTDIWSKIKNNQTGPAATAPTNIQLVTEAPEEEEEELLLLL